MIGEQMTGSVIDKLRGWVETSGRGLELRTVRAFRSRCQVEQAVRYPGREDDREIDLVARFDGIANPLPNDEHRPHLSLRVFVECKTARAGNPWVGFKDPGPSGIEAGNASHDLLYFHGSYNAIAQRFETAWDYEMPLLDYPTASHISDAFKRDESQPGKQNPKESSYAAFRQSVSGAEAGIADAIDDFQTQAGPPRGVGIMAAVVTTVPMYICELDERNDVLIYGVDKMGVRHLGRNGHASRVIFIHETALPTFLNDVDRVARRLLV
jgi:hypothetical protein